MTLSELNYDIYNKELLGIVVMLKEWRVFLQSTKEPFVVKTDYKNFTNFLTIKELNRRQVRWAEMLAEYYFEIEHVKGSDNARADALSRKKELQRNDKVSGALLKLDENGKIRYNHPQLLKTYKALGNLWEQWIKKAQETDSDYEDYKNREM